jgi:hypothetical protein
VTPLTLTLQAVTEKQLRGHSSVGRAPQWH